MSFDEKLVSGKELAGTKRRRSQTHIFQKFEPELQVKRMSEGWELDRVLSTQVKMKKAKSLDEQFEDEIWLLFASMGFEYMNKDRHLDFPYSATKPNLTKQIDVFAVDEETILFIECKCAQAWKKGNFKDDIEAIKGIRDGLFSEARKKFPDRKAIYILATKNYEVANPDLKRMEEFRIKYFNEQSIRYFAELTKHLGRSARYQLLGQLFEGLKIKAMNNKVPAIRGHMGGDEYYSFSIEPDKLLRIAYVLHRNDASSDTLPTYQRIIKKPRIKEIQKFIDKGGFFPNSLIISIDTMGRKIRFDLASPQEDSSIAQIGILYLPQYYRSAHIIDGQHRLYGYADTRYASNNTIPVIAFVNLAQDKQLELFMEINENQKAVSKTLRNTLNADLLWHSADWNKRRIALRLHLAQKLGDTPLSPLFNRIIIGENEASPTCCVTIETIENALRSTNFLSRYIRETVITKNGTFDKNDNEETLKILYPFLVNCFDYFKERLPDEWEKGERDLGVLSINISIQALIRVFNDIVNHLIAQNKIDPINDKTENIVENVEYYLLPLLIFFESITEDQRREIRTRYGASGKVINWRSYQKIIFDTRNDFTPDGLEQWIKDNSKQFNAESFSMLHDLNQFIKQDFAEKLENKYGDKWVIAGLPPKVYKQANNSMGKLNYENSKKGNSENLTIWDCVTLANCTDIAIFGPNWSELFKHTYTRPEEIELVGGKKAKIEWLNRLSKIGAKNNDTTSITEKDYLFLKSVHEWLLNK